MDTSACSKPYEGSTIHSKAQQVHLARLQKPDELDNRLPSVLLQDDSSMWATLKSSNSLYRDPQALFHDENFPKNMESQFQRLQIKDDDFEVGNMSVFSTGVASIEEQL